MLKYMFSIWVCLIFPRNTFGQDARTTVVLFENTTDFEVDVLNAETGKKFILSPKRKKEHVSTVSMTIPSCNTLAEFTQHHILLTIKDLRHHRVFTVWQRKVGNDARVRVSKGKWEDPGSKIQGESSVNGERKWVIRQDGPFSSVKK